MSERTFSTATAVAVAEAVRPWLGQSDDQPPPAAAIVAALRAAEAEHGGPVRDLWGHAAGNAEHAAAAADPARAGWLWATSLDYAARAVQAAPSAAVPPSGGTADTALCPASR
ncbi:hypothetical protein [Streptomyces olivaceus]|uniref:hypothetical protein n=1 Tax=Streptomyces olivaceus TaxID=47716 RepID=UPI00371C176B